MRLLTRFALLIALLIVAVPTFAQEDVTIDPTGEFTEVYVYENITVNYPAGMVVSDTDFQITLDFDGNRTDYIIIATPEAFDYFGIASDTFEIASESVFTTFSGSVASEVTYEDTVIEVSIAGLPATYFELETEPTIGYKIFAYTFMVGDAIYAVTLITSEAVLPAEDELVVLEGVIGSMTIDGVAIADIEAVPQPDITAEATEELVTGGIREVPAGASDVLLTQEIVAGDGELVFSLPEGWVYDEERIIFSNSEDALDAIDGGIEIGETDVTLQLISPSRMGELGVPEVTIDSVMTVILLQFPDAVIYEYEELGAYYVTITGEGVPTGAFFFMWNITENPEDVALVVGVAGDYDASEAEILAILGSVVYTAPTE